MHPDRLDKPLHWRDPRCVFVNSVSDLFHEEVRLAFVDQVFAVMAMTPQHRYIVLTKRPDRMAEYLRPGYLRDGIRMAAAGMSHVKSYLDDLDLPLSNVWIGSSIENQYWMKQRGDIMKEIDWPNKLASFEPLLGPIDPTGYEKVFQWFVIGGESGPGARPMHPLWASQIWHHLIPHAPGFWKQWGMWIPVSNQAQYQLTNNIIRVSKNMRRIHHNPKTTTDALDDRYMARGGSIQVYGGEWTEGRDIHQWPKSMKVEEVKNATR